ncbi:hypothetical protein Acr_06g0011860 [Actinidia rufa]|uniref:NB-ARC domain-containing disease resistance protein n=1 Tax=Actinidia rufa TaxID=165716 RepID=A0A7J0ESP9_9ERIC|nr:hypothetical protein Acr_06g0011860 [Actinidia rufa]
MAAEQVGDRSSGDSSRAYTSTGEEETIVGFEEEVMIIKRATCWSTKAARRYFNCWDAWNRSVMRHTNGIDQMSDEDLAPRLCKSLKGRRYFIVMDDIWDSRVWSDLKTCFPNDNNGSRIMFTSRNEDVALLAKSSRPPLSLRFLTDDESWVLFQQKLESLQMKRRVQTNGRKVGNTLNSQMTADPQIWLKTLALSYNHLPHHLKPCFLYFGLFPEDYQVPVCKLIWLWMAEGFIRETGEKSLEDVAEEYLMELIGRNLVLVSWRRYEGGVKACGIHDLLREFCIKQAEKECFLQQNFHELPVSYYAQPKDLFIDDSPSMSITYKFGLATRALFLKSVLDDLDYLRGMVTLRHLHLTTKGGILRIEEPGAIYPFSLDNLQTLSAIDAESCRDFLAGIPNIRKLGIRGCITFPNTDFLNHLQELKLWGNVFRRFDSSLIRLGGVRFPTNLKKLTLMESRVKWDVMSTIGKSLPNLEVLKLLKLACVGKCWKTSDADFPQLKFLKLVLLPIEEWQVCSNPFPRLQRLVLISCCALQNIPSEIGELPTLQMIEVHDCNTFVANSAHKIKEEQADCFIAPQIYGAIKRLNEAYSDFPAFQDVVPEKQPDAPIKA